MAFLFLMQLYLPQREEQALSLAAKGKISEPGKCLSQSSEKMVKAT